MITILCFAGQRQAFGEALRWIEILNSSHGLTERDCLFNDRNIYCCSILLLISRTLVAPLVASLLD